MPRKKEYKIKAGTEIPGGFLLSTSQIRKVRHMIPLIKVAILKNRKICIPHIHKTFNILEKIRMWRSREYLFQIVG